MKHTRGILLIGWAGTILLILAYALNSFGIISSTGWVYALLNLSAATFLSIRLYADRNWSNLTLEFFWASIALITLVRSTLLE